MGNQDWQQKWGALVAKSWEDEKLHDRLMKDAGAVLKEHGIEIPPGVQVKVVQNTSNVIHLPMPPKPSSDEISEEELAAVAGGAAQTCSVTYFGKTATGGTVSNPATRTVQTSPAVQVAAPAPAIKTTTGGG